MRYTIERNFVNIIGEIWQPGCGVCAMRKDLSAYDVENIAGYASEVFDSPTIIREAIEHWLSLNSGDFQSVADFSASIGATEFPWSNEESEFTFSDCVDPAN